MGRRKAREMALQALYQMDVMKMWGPGSNDVIGIVGRKAPDEVRDFFLKLTDGVVARRQNIDHLIEKYSEHWRVARMPVVDRNILRLAIYELQYCPEIPAKVAINEAVELGKRFNCSESASFINALLDRIAKQELNRDPEREP